MKTKKYIFTTFSFPQGILLFVKQKELLKEIKYLSSAKEVKSYLEGLCNKFKGEIVDDAAGFQKESELFARYFQGEPVDFSPLSLDFNLGTPFQSRVWREAHKIPYGQTSTYKQLALKINHLGYRSIGQALGRNPFLIAVPCHRVLSSDGSLGGFSAGISLKKYLLHLEKVL